MIPLLIAAICTVPQEAGALVRDECDLIETNHYYDENGNPVFIQAIFYDWNPAEGRFDVRAWRLVKCPHQLPHFDGRTYRATWFDGEALRSVRALSVRETWTQYDPELKQRSVLSKDRRRELTTAPQRTARVLKWWRW